MSTGFFNGTDWTGVALPNTILRPYQTEQAMLNDWSKGNLAAVISRLTPEDSSFVQEVGVAHIIIIDNKTVDDVPFTGRKCAASPEQRDNLARALASTQPSSIKLMTQQQYLNNPSDVDIFMTAVTRSSGFLNSIPFRFYLRNVAGADTFDAHLYRLSCNQGPVTSQKITYSLYR